MTIQEINREIDQLENDLEFYLNEKERIITKVLPKASDIKGETVDGGKRVDKLLSYVEELDTKKINETINYIQEKLNVRKKWLDNELEIMNKYGELEQEIIELKNMKLKDPYTKKWREYTWEEIANKVHYSKDYCRRVYRKCIRKRNI